MSGGLETNPYDRGRGRGGRDRGMDCFRAKGHDYTRETSRDSSSVDENAIDALLARLDSEYDTADEIRDQLMNQYSAGVTNRDKTWQTGGERAGGYKRQDGKQRNNRGPPRRTHDFLLSGHDYYQSEDAGRIGPNTKVRRNPQKFRSPANPKQRHRHSHYHQTVRTLRQPFTQRTKLPQPRTPYTPNLRMVAESIPRTLPLQQVTELPRITTHPNPTRLQRTSSSPNPNPRIQA